MEVTTNLFSHSPTSQGDRRVTFMVAFWRDIRMRPRRDGLPGASQPFPASHDNGSAPMTNETMPAAALSPLGVPLDVPADRSDAISAKLGSSGHHAVTEWPSSTDEGLPGPACFGTSLVPRERYTWHWALSLDSSEPEPFPQPVYGSGSGSGSVPSGEMDIPSMGASSGKTAGRSSQKSSEGHPHQKQAGSGSSSAAKHEPSPALLPGAVSVVATPVTGPIWSEVDPRACQARGLALSQLRGLPKYELCFQGF